MVQECLTIEVGPYSNGSTDSLSAENLGNGGLVFSSDTIIVSDLVCSAPETDARMTTVLVTGYERWIGIQLWRKVQ